MGIITTGTLLSAVTAAAMEITAAGRGETRAGVVPAGYDLPSTPVTDFDLTPALELELSSPRSQLSVAYAPHIFYRLPDPEAAGPLFLHQFLAEHVAALTASWDITSQGALNVGDVNYDQALYLLDTSRDVATSVPDAAVIRFLSIAGESRAEGPLSPRQTLAVGARLAVNHPLSGSPEEDPIFPTQIMPALVLEHATALTRNDGLIAGAELGAAYFSPGPTFAALRVIGGWNRLLTRAAQLTLRGGGIAAVRFAAEQSDGIAFRLLPVLLAGYDHAIPLWGGWRAGWALMGGTDGVYDLIRAELVPGVTLAATTTLGRPRGLGLRMAASFFTPAGEPPVPEDPASLQRDPTIMTFEAAASHPLTEELALQGGFRLSATAPHLAEQRWMVDQIAAVGFLAIEARWHLWGPQRSSTTAEGTAP